MNALTIVHEVIKKHIGVGSICVDATAGRGFDTAFLSEIVGEKGKVYAFDIQEDAINSTKELLDSKGLKATLILDSHANMSNYINEQIDLIVFNLGYLPKGDHNIYTHADSTIKAIESGLNLLKKGGLMCISVYYGGDSGYEEKDTLLPYLKNIDDEKYQVLGTFFYNWKKDPPIPFFIIKN